MDSSTNEVAHEFPPYFKVYKDGRVERLGRFGVTDLAPTCLDPKTEVQSKDVVVCSDIGISARIFLPKLNRPNHKLPLVVHYHGGAFCIRSPCNRTLYNRLVNLTSEANAVIVSIAHEDSWAALQWIANHSNGQGPELWLKDHANF